MDGNISLYGYTRKNALLLTTNMITATCMAATMFVTIERLPAEKVNSNAIKEIPAQQSSAIIEKESPITVKDFESCMNEGRKLNGIKYDRRNFQSNLQDCRIIFPITSEQSPKDTSKLNRETNGTPQTNG